MAAKFLTNTHIVRAVTVAGDDIQSILQKKNLRGSDLPQSVKSQSWDLYRLSPPPRSVLFPLQQLQFGGDNVVNLTGQSSIYSLQSGNKENQS